MISRLDIVVRSTEVDTYGHVNNAKYLEYLEWGRYHWMKEIGMTEEALAEEQLGTVVANINVNYRKEALMGETLQIQTALMGIGNRSFRLKQDIYNASGELVSDAVVTSVMFNRVQRRSVPIPEEIREWFKQVLAKQ